MMRNQRGSAAVQIVWAVEMCIRDSNASLAGHESDAADQVVQDIQREAAFLLALFETAPGGVLGHLLRGGHLLRVVAKGAMQSVEGGGLQSLRIIFVYDEVREVVTHVRAWVQAFSAGDGVRSKREQGSVQFGVIVGEVENGLTGCGKDRGAIGGLQCCLLYTSRCV